MPFLDTSDPALNKALDEILDLNSDTEWVILGHVKQTMKIKVVEKGEGFSDMVDEFSDTQCQYAIHRFTVNNTYKAALITWCGDSVVSSFRGKFQAFVKDMEHFLKGRYHCQVNARSEDDLDKDEIVKLVQKGLHNYDAQAKPGVKSTVTIQSQKESLSKAATEVKIQRQDKAEVDKEASQKYWEKNQVQEKEVKTTQVDVKANTDEKKKFWTAPKATTEPVEKKKVEIDTSESKKFWEKQKEQEEQDKPSWKKQEPTVTASTSDLKSKFENLSKKEEEPSWKKKEPGQSKWKKPEPVQSQSEPEKKPVPQFKKPEPVPEPEPVYEEPEVQPEPEPVYEPEPEPEVEPEPVYEEPEPEVISKPKAPYSALKNQPEPEFDEPEPEPEPVYEEPEPEPVYEPEPEESNENLYCAQYDFESEDPDELPFQEGDVLNILQEGEDWWTAELNGRTGLVPANYLEKL
eukprot:gene1296-11380_t